jgi:hypothetical protein
VWYGAANGLTQDVGTSWRQLHLDTGAIAQCYAVCISHLRWAGYPSASCQDSANLSVAVAQGDLNSTWRQLQ